MSRPSWKRRKARTSLRLVNISPPANQKPKPEAAAAPVMETTEWSAPEPDPTPVEGHASEAAPIDAPEQKDHDEPM